MDSCFYEFGTFYRFLHIARIDRLEAIANRQSYFIRKVVYFTTALLGKYLGLIYASVSKLLCSMKNMARAILPFEEVFAFSTRSIVIWFNNMNGEILVKGTQ